VLQLCEPRYTSSPNSSTAAERDKDIPAVAPASHRVRTSFTFFASWRYAARMISFVRSQSVAVGALVVHCDALSDATRVGATVTVAIAARSKPGALLTRSTAPSASARIPRVSTSRAGRAECARREVARESREGRDREA
jgi:hypothetical protein